MAKKRKIQDAVGEIGGQATDSKANSRKKATQSRIGRACDRCQVGFLTVPRF
jgi:hypothetical protein